MSSPAVEAPADPQAESGPIPLRSIEAELTRRLKAAQGEDGGTIHRAQMSNLVIYCDGEEEFRAVDRDIPRIVAAHPARVILAYGRTDLPAADVSATVQVRVVRSVGGARIAAERVTLQAAGRSVDRLPYAVRGLLVGDLPNNLWWNSRTPPPLAGSLLADLSERSEHVLYDSLAWNDPNRGVEETALWLAQFADRPGSRWRVASDLNWRRLKGLASADRPVARPGLGPRRPGVDHRGGDGPRPPRRDPGLAAHQLAGLPPRLGHPGRPRARRQGTLLAGPGPPRLAPPADPPPGRRAARGPLRTRGL